MPVWAAILKYRGEDEVTYFSSRTAWEDDPYLTSDSYQKGDMLIDCNGVIYRLLNKSESKLVIFEKSGTMALAVFSQLIKKHLVILDQCCVDKLSLSTYAEGFQLVKDKKE